MRYAAALFVVISGFVLGKMKRESSERTARITVKLAELLNEFMENIRYSGCSYIALIEKLSVSESFAELGFLRKCADMLENGEELSVSLKMCFDEWEGSGCLGGNEKSLTIEAFSEIGLFCKKQEESRLVVCRDKLFECAAVRQEELKKHKGLYESVYTLAGIAAAVAVI
ncbi:MAG: hypothetical protein RR058_04695 [Oscillospiraceae bacterium]